jgi:hypothetical protein
MERSMSSYTSAALHFYDMMTTFWTEQAEWSQRTFGGDRERGPIGALRHLSLEALEAVKDPKDIVEYADCFILLMDAVRRAGFTPTLIIEESLKKLERNKLRTWPAPTGEDEPVEHVR